jgi:hypothetical protein
MEDCRGFNKKLCGPGKDDPRPQIRCAAASGRRNNPYPVILFLKLNQGWFIYSFILSFKIFFNVVMRPGQHKFSLPSFLS